MHPIPFPKGEGQVFALREPGISSRWERARPAPTTGTCTAIERPGEQSRSFAPAPAAILAA